MNFLKLFFSARYWWPDYSKTYRIVRIAVLIAIVLSWPAAYVFPASHDAMTWTRVALASFSIGCDVEHFWHLYRNQKRIRKAQIEELDAEIAQWRAEALADLETKKEQP